ncbi:SIR2 family protein [Singulisphaera sp. PoT]|uniref:P-loop NTPase n=1 Tax=Singulisphaera sp. PoT TaxID=3411797 RepID=UPI003BF49DAE
MELPSGLVSAISDGRAVLLLGAGASFEAKNPRGQKPPSGAKLAEMLANKFLGGEFKDYPLNMVSEYAISETDLVSVQEYLREVFEEFEPTDSHKKLTTFRWRGLATTNYDRLVEGAYETTQGAVQKIVPFLGNGDRVDERLRHPDSLPYLKLHGCITRTSDQDLPLILTTDQYIDHLHGRDRLFDRFRDWAWEHTIVFIGYGYQDSDLRAIPLQLEALKASRLRNYLIVPGIKEIQRRFWETKKVTCLDGTFDSFIAAINLKVGTTFRGLLKDTPVGNLAIAARFVRKSDRLDARTEMYLSNEVDYVKAVKTEQVIAPSSFYKGMNLGWAGVEQGLDVRRKLGDTIHLEHFFEEGEKDLPEFVVVKAPAGSGKTILLQRIAWDATQDLNRLCLYVRPEGTVDARAVRSIVELCRERVFLLVDDAPSRVGELRKFFREIGEAGKWLTLITTARTNEWNISGSPLSAFVTDEYELEYLSDVEISQLLVLLEKHNALGTLRKLDENSRRQELADRAGRQILVALHEATYGKPFVEIIRDEYDHIVPHEAQQIYLTTCILNRLDVPVRAGIISRLHGITFEQFKERFFAPLELVVRAKTDPISKDKMYLARHPHIAEIVFQEVLTDPEERLQAYLDCLESLNVDYQPDRRAFRLMVRARSLMEIFSDYTGISKVYLAAEERVGEDHHLFHQMAIFEMIRPNGDLERAASLLKRASEIRADRSVLHSMAELELRLADESGSPLEAERHLRNAADSCIGMMRNSTDAHPYHTSVKIWLRRIRYALIPDSRIGDSELEGFVREAEKVLDEGYKRFPNDTYLASAEADLASTLSDSDRAMRALDKAFANNNKNAYIGTRLARIYARNNDILRAVDVLKRAIQAKPSDKRLHYDYAKLLVVTRDADLDETIYHLRNSFSPGDTNFDAQVLYARQLYLKGNMEECRSALSQMNTTEVSWEQKEQICYPLEGTFQGTVSKIKESYCFILRDGIGDSLFAGWRAFSKEAWKLLMSHSRVEFRIGFTMKGVRAFEVKLLG